MKCRCDACERTFDSHDEGYVMVTKVFCTDCFEEKFQCEDCGGFKNKFAMAEYDTHYCECD